MRNSALKGLLNNSPTKHGITQAKTVGTGVNKRRVDVQVYHTHETPEGTVEHTLNKNRLVKGKGKLNKKTYIINRKTNN